MLPTELLAVNVALNGPVAVGVPLITPFVATESPPGRFVPEKVIGAYPVAVMLLLNSTPTVPEKALVLVMVGGVCEILVTVPSKVKSSKRKVCDDAPPVIVNTTVTVPINPVFPVTVCKPTLEPEVGTALSE